MKNLVKILKNLLLIFVLLSIGFALGRHSIKREAIDKKSSQASLIRVYYMHGSVRCRSCNKIEKMTKDLLKNKYSKAMTGGRIDFLEVDFQKNKTLAKRFDIIASCVVVAKLQADKIISYQRLDEVWTLFHKPPKFNEYISKAIDKYLPKQDKK